MTTPDAPEGLLQAARGRWDAFWASPAAQKVNVESDLPRLTRWIEQTDEYDRVAKVCRKTRLVKGSMGQPVLNPLFSYLAQLDAQIVRTEADFGMTPLARRRLAVADVAAPATDSLDELAARRDRKAAGA
jgi:P27 family predicted phage terminase small subunit